MNNSNKNPHATNKEDFLSGSLIITRPFYKYALLAYVIAAIIIIAWAIFGSIPHRIEGMGEINSSDGLFKVTTIYKGQVQKVNVSVHDIVNEGDNLFVLSQPELEISIRELETSIRLLESKDSLIDYQNNVSLKLHSGLNSIELKKLKVQIAEADKNISFLNEKVDNNKKLYNDGLITYTQYFSILNSLQEAISGKLALEGQISSLSLNTQEWLFGKSLNSVETKSEIEKLKEQLANLKNEYQLNTEVKALKSGYIVQLNIGFGDIVSPGMDLATIEKFDNGENYIMDLYVPFSANAKIANGMEVDIEPFTVDRNLYGWLKGKVIQVNEYVSSGLSLVNDLDNEDLARTIEEKGPVYKIVVQLQTDSTTTSGFAWSNKKGPPYKITVGSLAQAYIKVKDKSPIDYLIPIFREYFE
jgi:HlyD family secretion protein